MEGYEHDLGHSWEKYGPAQNGVRLHLRLAAA
jgi:hypothetical protein